MILSTLIISCYLYFYLNIGLKIEEIVYKSRYSHSEIVSRNKKCLQYLLENNIVEYYYHPENDDDNLNFNTRGIKTKARLSKEYTKPSLVLCSEPTFIYDQTRLPKDLCWPLIAYYMPNMMARDYDLLRNLLKFFKHVASLSGMEYYLNYGSLLGHVRFDKRPIPWDDDIDFSIDYSFFKNFEKRFKSEQNLYFGDEPENGTFYPELYSDKSFAKIFDASQKKFDIYNWTFPFIDLFYYGTPKDDNNATNDLNFDSISPLVNADMLFQNTKMPNQKEFLGIALPIPMDTIKMLKHIYHFTNSCRPLRWYHRFEKARTLGYFSSIECSLLEGIYDF